MPAPMAAEAAGYYAGAARLADKDLVDLPEPEQKNELDSLRAKGAAPAALQGKTDAEAVQYLRAQKGRRAELQGRIRELQDRRDAYLAQEPAAKDGFDEQVVQALRDRAAAAGVRF